MRGLRTVLLLALALLLPCPRAGAYSLLTHEQLIDLTWKDSIVPLLLSRYPNLTAAELDRARAYAYGGCVIQDIGYYPFGDKSFSNLTHYVRSGDFVVNLFRNAQNANELAFAVGALSHYIGDAVGHPMATNRAVPVEFPALQEQYGSVVNYAEGRTQHVRTEFGFDIDEIAHHRVAPLSFLRHMGLKVPVRQLELAYYQTYGLGGSFSTHRRGRFNVREYRFAVRTFIPRIAYAVTLLHRRHEPADPDTPEAREVIHQAAAAATENHWDRYRRKPGFITYSLAGLLFVLPRVGPLKLVAVKGPTPETEADYMRSVAVSTRTLRRMVANFTPPASSAAHAAPASAPLPLPEDLLDATGPEAEILLRSTDPQHPLPNRDLDTGYVVRPGGYPLTDATYALLLHRLVQQPTLPIPPGIQRDILAYYADPDAQLETREGPSQWAQIQADLAVLAKMPTSTEPPLFPTYEDPADE